MLKDEVEDISRRIFHVENHRLHHDFLELFDGLAAVVDTGERKAASLHFRFPVPTTFNPFVVVGFGLAGVALFEAFPENGFIADGNEDGHCFAGVLAERDESLRHYVD